MSISTSLPGSVYFNLTPIPLKQSSIKPFPEEQASVLRAKLDKCRRHIARLENSLTFRRTDKSITSILINVFKKDEASLANDLAGNSLPQHFGQLYRAKMPREIGKDTESLSKGIKELKDAKITHLFLLCMDQECVYSTGVNLRKLYQDNGFKVIHFPVKDFGAWDQTSFNAKIHHLHDLLMSGANVVVHCMGGIGRTGTIIAAEAAKALNLDGNEAIKYARQHSHVNAVETPAQQRLVNLFAQQYNKALV